MKQLLEDGDAVIFSIDFEALCCEKLTDGEYRYSPVTEVGIATLDLRQLKGQAGDRGKNWHRLINASHLIVNEYCDHYGNDFRRPWCKPDPYRFAFGQSKFIAEEDVSAVVGALYKEAREQNRTSEEMESQQLREVIVLTWDSTLEESIANRLGLAVFTESRTSAFDLQKHALFSDYFGNGDKRGKSSEAACDSLGIATCSIRFGSLHHCGGNDAVFTLHKFLALETMGRKQLRAYTAQESLRCLSPSFREATVAASERLTPGSYHPRRRKSCYPLPLIITDKFQTNKIRPLR